MLRLWWISRIGCKEWNLTGNCPTGWTMTSLRDLVPENCAWCTHGKVAVWLHGLSFLLPSLALLLQPPESPSKPALCPTKSLFHTILDHWIKTYLSHVPLKSQGWKGVQSYIPVSFKAWIPNHLLNGHFTLYFNTPKQKGTCYLHCEASMIIRISPLYWVKLSQNLPFTSPGPPLRGKHKSGKHESTRTPFRYLKAIWQSSVPVKEGNTIAWYCSFWLFPCNHWFLSNHNPSV